MGSNTQSTGREKWCSTDSFTARGMVCDVSYGVVWKAVGCRVWHVVWCLVYHACLIGCFFEFYVLATSKVMLGQVPTCDSAHSWQAYPTEKERVFYLTTPLEHIDFHIVGHWASSTCSLWYISV